MKKFFETGNAYFLVAFIFLVAGFLGQKIAAFFTLAVVFFVLGIAVRKKNARGPTDPTPKT